MQCTSHCERCYACTDRHQPHACPELHAAPKTAALLLRAPAFSILCRGTFLQEQGLLQRQWVLLLCALLIQSVLHKQSARHQKYEHGAACAANKRQNDACRMSRGAIVQHTFKQQMCSYGAQH
jgi:hypothetical protein